MIFAGSSKSAIYRWRDRNHNVRQSGKQMQEIQYTRLADISKQRLLGYAESFRELAESLREERGSCSCIAMGDRQSVLEERMLRENRGLISSNLNEVAGIMSQIASGELCYESMDERIQKNVIQALRTEGVCAEGLCYQSMENGNKAVGMILYTKKKGGVASDDVADILSVILKIKLEVSPASPYIVDRNKRSFLFVEEARYVTFTGLSRAVKETENISGDNFAILQSETGKMTVLLSDGTGSGERAHSDSGKVLDLMEKMLEAGFGMETAINMVNTALLSKGDESNHPTLDICNLDLYQGSCDIWKVGGALTLLKRDGTVDKISQGTLPLGIFQSMDIPKQHRRLQDGDYLIFITDGVRDALEEKNSGEMDSEELLAETVRNMPERNPQDLAEKLLHNVLRNSSGHIRDDMTILVVGIWKNT